MYICIYVYMYICIYVYMYICIYVYPSGLRPDRRGQHATLHRVVFYMHCRKDLCIARLTFAFRLDPQASRHQETQSADNVGQSRKCARGASFCSMLGSYRCIGLSIGCDFCALWAQKGTPRAFGGCSLHILCHKGVFSMRFGGPKGAFGAPLGHSLGSLCSHLRALWQDMFRMSAFRGARGGIRRPNGVKVASLHHGLCAITIVKTDVSTTPHFFAEFAPKWRPKGSQGHPLVPFWAHLVSRCRLFGVPCAICGPLWGPLWIWWDFVGPGAPREFAGGRGAATCRVMGKHHLGLAGVGYT